MTVLANFGRENVGMILSIGQSVWTVVKGNFSLVLHSMTAIVSVLMGGGTAILNFFVNGVNNSIQTNSIVQSQVADVDIFILFDFDLIFQVIFLTALYYLLAASDCQYKPVQLFSLLSPGAGNSLAVAMEDAVNNVCMASLKLISFYGLWTWLIHTIFQVNFVVIPAGKSLPADVFFYFHYFLCNNVVSVDLVAAIAALLGAVPFLGTYWAALPAALDLWLAQSRGLEAVLLMVFQFLPTLLVDAAFYAEIKGGGHPYLTGLAVAGGIFWMGFEGAIIGPLLLCGLLVAFTMYTSLMQESHVVVEVNSRLLHRRLIRTGTIA